MATPVVTVASGGLPVVDVTASTPKLGLPVTEALAGRGMAVTKVAARGMPVTYSTVADYPPPSGGMSAEAAAFLARTSGLDATHTNAYTALIDGLVADGIWSKLDALYIFATNSSANALLNLVSTSYNGTLNGALTFVADRGFTGTQNSTTINFNSNFNPTTASSPKFTSASAHGSVWVTSDVAGTNNSCMGESFSTNNGLSITPRYTDGKTYCAITGSTVLDGGTNANAAGHYIGNKSDSTHAQCYRNGSSIASSSSANTQVPPNYPILVCAQYSGGTPMGSLSPVSGASFGSSLNSTEAGNLYTRLRTYMTAVGVP